MRTTLPPPPHALRRGREEKRDVALARALGWFSVGLGVAALAAPRPLHRAIGTGQDHVAIARLTGVREVATGIGLLQGRSPPLWLWARVAGDLVDLALLGVAMGERRSRRGQLAVAAAAVAGVTALDLYAARRWSGREMPRETPDTGVVDVQRAITVNASPQACYDTWHRFEDLPRFMRHLESVTTVGAGVTHWVAKAPFGATVEWDAEVTSDQPGQLLAWRSVDESEVEQTGVVRFEPGPRGGTIVTVEMRYRPPAGRVGATVAKLFGDEPTQAVLEDLRRFKRLMETGEIPTTEGQPHGRRGMFYQLMRKVHTR
ncbi:MAG TPA: SRPBCC family protein [Casimicrobiaceae bacterium]|nr:SRPBCC family protein [Casimicrobiaceae bacterium]